MPVPGAGNNGLGINAFSGPMGEKEPAYGATERLKVLSRIIPTGSPAAQNAPRRAKRAALRRSKAAPAGAAAPNPSQPIAQSPDMLSGTPPQTTYDMQLQQFWTQLAAEPNASPLVKQYAAQVTNGA